LQANWEVDVWGRRSSGQRAARFRRDRRSSSSELGSVLDSGNIGWNLAANALVPIFRAGVLKANVEQTAIEQRQAVLQYASAALAAFQEVENELDQGRILARRHNAVEIARNSAREALRLIRPSYQQGESTLQEVLQVEQEVFSTNSTYQALHRLRPDQFADLNVALGGDWRVPVPQNSGRDQLNSAGMNPALQIAVGSVMLYICASWHIFAISELIARLKKWYGSKDLQLKNSFRMTNMVFLGILIAHTVQIYFWAGVLWLTGAIPDFRRDGIYHRRSDVRNYDRFSGWLLW